MEQLLRLAAPLRAQTLVVARASQLIQVAVSAPLRPRVVTAVQLIPIALIIPQLHATLSTRPTALGIMVQLTKLSTVRQLRLIILA